MRRGSLAAIAIAAATGAAACGGTYGGGGTTLPAASKTSAGSGDAPIDIRAAALPYSIVDGHTGEAIDTAAFWTRLAGTRVVCVGEEHSNPHSHWAELEIASHLFPQWPHAALGLEMIQRPFQRVLDNFADGKIDDAQLRSRVGWDDRWGYDYAFYGPTLAVAIHAHAALLALNAPKELTKKVAHHGLASLSPDEAAQIPQLDLADAKHRAWFDSMMDDMGGSEGHAHAMAGSAAEAPAMPADMPTADNIYTVQVIWDETMADTAAKWLAANPQAHVVILAGNGHCHDSAIVGRLKRRGVASVASVRSIVDTGDGEVADALAKPINDYLVVLAPPKSAAADQVHDR